MFLTPSQFEILSQIVEEDHPSTRLGMWAECIASQLTRDVWVRRVDTAIVGGDPLAFFLALRGILRRSNYRRPPRVLIAHQGGFPGAPLAALEDPQFVEELVSEGVVPSSFVPVRGDASERAVKILERAQSCVLRSLETLSSAPYFTCDPLEAQRMPSSGDFVLRVTRERDQCRGPAWSKIGKRSAESFPPPAEGRGGHLHLSSKLAFEQSFARFETEFRGMCLTPPVGQRFADAFFAREVMVLSGVVSVRPQSGEFAENSERMSALGMNVFRMAEGIPISVADAVNSWRADLVRASRNLG